MVRAFVAFEISEEMRDRLTAAQEILRKSTARLAFVDPPLIHITVKFLGEVDEKKLPLVIRALDTVKAVPFPATGNRVTVNNFKSPHTVWCAIDDAGKGRGVFGAGRKRACAAWVSPRDPAVLPPRNARPGKDCRSVALPVPRRTQKCPVRQLHGLGLETQEKHAHAPGPGVRGPARGGMVSGVPGRLPLEEKILAEQLRPSAEERAYIRGMADRLLAAIAASGKAEGMVVGSIARDTWVKATATSMCSCSFPRISPGRRSKRRVSPLPGALPGSSPIRLRKIRGAPLHQCNDRFDRCRPCALL